MGKSKWKENALWCFERTWLHNLWDPRSAYRVLTIFVCISAAISFPFRFISLHSIWYVQFFMSFQNARASIKSSKLASGLFHHEQVVSGRWLVNTGFQRLSTSTNESKQTTSMAPSTSHNFIVQDYRCKPTIKYNYRQQPQHRVWKNKGVMYQLFRLSCCLNFLISNHWKWVLIAYFIWIASAESAWKMCNEAPLAQLLLVPCCYTICNCYLSIYWPISFFFLLP